MKKSNSVAAPTKQRTITRKRPATTKLTAKDLKVGDSVSFMYDDVRVEGFIREIDQTDYMVQFRYGIGVKGAIIISDYKCFTQDEFLTSKDIDAKKLKNTVGASLKLNDEYHVIWWAGDNFVKVGCQNILIEVIIKLVKLLSKLQKQAK